MENENAEAGEFTPEEKAYFDNRGDVPEKPVETPAAEAVPEAEVDAGEGGEDKPKGSPQVPLRALTKEREGNKEYRKQLDELRTKYAVMEDRWNRILQPQPEPEPTPQPPDPEQDIFAYSKWQAEQLEALKAKIEGKEQQETQTIQQREAERAVWDYWEKDGKAFAAQTPDFGDAATWLAETRDKQLQALSVADPRFADKRARDAQMNAELKDIIVAAGQQGASPAQYVYEIAKAWGYAGPKPKADADPVKEIEKLAANVEAERTLSSAAGSPSRPAPTAEDIANMSPDDFEAWFKKHGEKGFKRIAS